MTVRPRLALMGASALASFAFACGDGDGNTAGFATFGEDNPAETTTHNVEEPATSAPAESPPASATGPSAATSTPPAAERSMLAREALLNGVEKLDQATYHVTYRLDLGDAEGSYKGKVALAQDGARSLFSMELQSETDGDFVFSILDDGEFEYFCFEGAGLGASQDAGCLRSDRDTENPIADDFPLNSFEEKLRRMAEDGEVTIEEAPDRTVSGRAAKCLTVTDDGETGTACVAKSNGFLLLIDAVLDGEDVHLEVESYTETPAPTVFAPPYHVTDFGFDSEP